ncbi:MULTISPECIES: MAPEG family protein [unclassified Bradyrhizobium]|uniref:MAPEG family protein n=1 Tax=unclassified Bradyrhizobium TaxID=2631580 RepID=UPI00040042E9|nr:MULTISPECIES: MAPEG family protein [unclassified Bradyrhizobium]MCP3463696.1 MAPEG family protein [Bradyrhizobium sp. CCGUVB23]
MNIAIICTALLGLLLFGLGFYVSILRGRFRRSIGHDLGPTDPIHRAVRAHANTAEYAPFFAAMFLWFATRPAPSWIIVTIVVATIARFSLAAGLLWGKSLNRPNPARFAGALFTYLCGLALAVGLVVA